jgi:hypothetical protein
MADLVITAASVLNVSGPIRQGTAGTAITAGEALEQDPATGNLLLAKSDTVTDAACVGIALNSAGAGQPINYAPAGSTVNIGAVGTAGQTYVVSANAGQIAPISDLATGNKVTILGVMTTTSLLVLNINATGIAHA